MNAKRFLGKILDELNEPDAEAAPHHDAPPPTVQASAVTVPVYVPAAPAATPDEQTMKIVRASVFPPTVNGHASLYAEFVAMWEALGRPATAAPVLAAMKVHAPDLTPLDVLGDIDAHMKLLADNATDAGRAQNRRVEVTMGQ